MRERQVFGPVRIGSSVVRRAERTPHLPGRHGVIGRFEMAGVRRRLAWGSHGLFAKPVAQASPPANSNEGAAIRYCGLSQET